MRVNQHRHDPNGQATTTTRAFLQSKEQIDQAMLQLSFTAFRLYRTAMRSKNPDRPTGAKPTGVSIGGGKRPGGGFARPGHARDNDAGSGLRAPLREAAHGPAAAKRQPSPDRSSGPRPSRAPTPEARAAAAQQLPRLGQPRPPRTPDPAPPQAAETGARTLRAPATLAARPIVAMPAVRAAHGPAAPRGSVWLHGLHPVAAALANPSRRLKRLLLTEEAESTLLARLPQPWPLPTERVDRAKLDHLLGRDTVHQGAGLLADLLAPPVLSAVLERPGPVLVLDQVVDPRNIGAVLRSAAAFGAACVITQDRNAPEETGVLAKAASGALEQVPLLRAVNLARTLAALKAAGLWVIGLDSGGAPLRGAPFMERRVALVLGAEGAGLRRLTRETCDEIAGLAMPGLMESLNVSAAATVALYELTRVA